MKHGIVLFVFILSFSSNVYSAPGAWTPSPQKIEKIIIESGVALILLKGGVPTDYIPPSCNEPYNQADLSTEHGRAIYSMALAAQLAGKPVSIALGCQGSRPLITHIRLAD